MASASEEPFQLRWRANFAHAPHGPRIPKGDKIILPQSALEELLTAAPRISAPSSRSFTAFDPSNPYSVAAAQREQSLYRETQQQLPHPLMFKLYNQKNGNVVYAGVQEFSADPGQVGLSPYLKNALGIEDAEGSNDGAGAAEATAEVIDLTSEDEIPGNHSAAASSMITIQAQQLPKGTFVRLRPLEAGYNPDDWKSLLERQLRGSFTTLTKGCVFSVRGAQGEEFQFLVHQFKPEGDGICVVDTDLEVDIEALDEEQARESLRRIAAKSQRNPTGAARSSDGGELGIWKAVEGQVLPGEYVDYDLPAWDKARPLRIELTGIGDGEAVDLLVSPRSARQRVAPRLTEHVFASFETAQAGGKAITLQPTNVELEDAEGLRITVSGWKAQDIGTQDKPWPFTLRARIDDGARAEEARSDDQDTNSSSKNEDDEQCTNCRQWIPRRTIALHENFCRRNNVPCPTCSRVFHKNSEEWDAHWHCEHGDGGSGDSASSKAKHETLFHTPQACPSESCRGLSFYSVPHLASHRTSTCPGKLILCQFCHLEVPQEGDPRDASVDAETVLTGLTPHERADGARTTDCHLCGTIVRLRDMSAHLRHHDLDKQNRPKPEICRDELCGRTLHGVGSKGQVGAGTRMGQGPGNPIGLCSICFGPLYVSMHDPEGKALRRRIERRYLTQLLTGCGKKWCVNEWCKTGRAHSGLEAKGGTASAALPLVKPLVIQIEIPGEAMHFCVDEGAQKKRKLAEMIASEGGWDLEWCVAACEAEGTNLDKAREWLLNWAPNKYQQK